jgi:hypothetical protein
MTCLEKRLSSQPWLTVSSRSSWHLARVATLRLAFWMQTMGTGLVAVRQHSLGCMWRLALGSCSAYGLLYVVAVRDDRLPGPLLRDSQIGEHGRSKIMM